MAEKERAAAPVVKKKKKGKRKPLRLAQHWFAESPRLARHMALTLAGVVVLGMLFSSLQGIKTLPLRYGLSALIAAALLALFFSEGLNKGVSDAADSRFYVQQKEKGRALEAHDDAACYHPLKALCACLILFALPLALSLFIAAIATPYTYALQDLPAWLTNSYGARADVMGPLGAYGQAVPVGASSWLRALSRLFVMIFINFFDDPLRMTATIDRLAPLFILLYPLAFMAGYLYAPRAERERERQRRRAKKVAVRKAQKSNLTAELTGEQNAVHYGQRAEGSKHKRKELI